GAVIVDGRGQVMVHGIALVVLGVDGHLLLALGVVEGDLVAAAAGGVAVGLESTHLLAGGQGEGRHLLGVVDAAQDDGPGRVAFEEIDDHLLADARDVDAPPALAGPGGGDADPARAVLVLPAVPVPGELDLDPAVLVAEDFLPGRADDHGRL